MKLLFSNIFAALTKDRYNPTLQKIIELYHSKEVIDVINKSFT